MIRTAALVILSLSLSSLPAYAADGNRDTATAAPDGPARTNISDVAQRNTDNVTWGTRAPGTADGGYNSALFSDVDWSLPSIKFGPAKRPAALPALYVSLAALQAFDVYSTRRGLGHGASEANPLTKGVAGSPAMFWTVKAAATAGTILMAERLWKTNKAGAIAVMVLSNGVMAAVAAHNARVLRQR